MNNEQTIRDLYAAFQRGDIDAIVAKVTDDVDWRNDGVASRECPWNGNFSGKRNLPGFFQAVGTNLDLSVFDVRAVVSSGASVAVLLRVEGTVKNNGNSFENDAVHFWTFTSDGKVARYRHFNDTAAELAAWRG